MINDDIDSIQNSYSFFDNSFLYSVLSGEGWIPYNQLTDEQVETEYLERISEIEED